MNPDALRDRLRELREEPLIDVNRIPGLAFDDLRRAAVLVALTEIHGDFHAVFTRRPDTMPEHSGEVSFPGGGTHGDETPLETALREAHEEIALAPEDVDVLGAMVQLPTVTGYDITAFVGEFPYPYELQPDPREIDALFLAPLRHLMDPANRRKERHTWKGVSFDLHFFDYQAYTIWGATGYILHELLEYLRTD